MSYRRLSAARYFGSTKQEQLAYLTRTVKDCRKCPNIPDKRNNTVFGEGNPDASIMFVGEAPGADEDLIGRPFVGQAGKLLTKFIERLGATRRDVYIANVLKCRPDTALGQGNRTPTRPEMLDCFPYLKAQIEIIDPIVIVALGATALEAFDIDDKITECRGQKLEYGHSWLIPTFHPAYVLRNPTVEVRKQVWEDFVNAWELSGGSVDGTVIDEPPTIGV